MDYYLLADLAGKVGYQLAMTGAETFRVEDTVSRILRAYGVECQVFAIPNSLTVSFETDNGKPMTILRRIGFHGNDLEALEQLNALSRRICLEKPPVETAMEWLEETLARCRVYRPAVFYLGSFLGGLGFALVFGGTLRDCLWAGLMGLIIGGVNWGLVGIFEFDLVAWLFGGAASLVSRAIYILVAISAVWCITLLFRNDQKLVEVEA